MPAVAGAETDTFENCSPAGTGSIKSYAASAYGSVRKNGKRPPAFSAAIQWEVRTLWVVTKTKYRTRAGVGR